MPNSMRELVKILRGTMKKDHSLLPQYPSPSISASTTVTNFSSFQSLNKADKYTFPDKVNAYYPGYATMGQRGQNMVIGAGEIAPLNDDAKYFDHMTSPSINSEYSPYNETTTALPPHDHPEQVFSIAKQIFAAVAVSLGSMTVGYVSAYTSPALDSMRQPNSTLTVDMEEGSWIGSLMPLSALFGGITGGSLIEFFGRKVTIMATALPFILSWLLIAFANNVHQIYAARIIGGFCVGIASLALPVYLGETVQPKIRGMLGLLPTAFGNVGILVVFTAGNFLNWSQLAVLGAILPIPFLLCMFLVPETPRWYVSKNKPYQAEAALHWLRGKHTDINFELDEIQRSHNQTQKSRKNGFSELFKLRYLKALLVSLGLMFFQQLSGINAVIFYTVMIFKSAGSTIDENLCTIIVGIVNFASTFVATMMVDRLGRKMLLYISGIAMTLTLATLSIFFYLKYIEVDLTYYGWVPLASFVVYVIGFSLGFGPIPWLMMGEILPAKIRGSAASLVTGFNWTCTFVVTKTFVDIIEVMGIHGAFGMFTVICFLSIIFTVFCVPETQGRSLEEIEKALTKRASQHIQDIQDIESSSNDENIVAC